MEKRIYSPEDRDRIYRQCLEAYGDLAQMDMAIEEMSELMKALLKWRRATQNLQAKGILRTNIVEEIADVKIMMRQMELLFDCEEEVAGWIDYKVERQTGRLSELTRKEGSG